MTYVAPLFKDGDFSRGYVAIQLKQDYSELVPGMMFTQPSPAAFYAVYN